MSSARMNMNKSNTSAAYQKKFCGICKAVGKSEEEYSSHFTKSAPGPKGVVTCPVILSSVCKCCFKQGHFADHCPKRAVQNETNNANAKAKKVINVTVTVNNNKSSMNVVNRYNILRDLEDDTEPEPVISTPAKKTFASVLASPPSAPVKKSACSEIVHNVPNVPTVPVSVKLTTVLPLIPKANQTRRSWADTTDSDSGEDEDDCDE